MNYIISQKAQSDLFEIAFYTMIEFGDRQTDIYQEKLMDCMNTISKNPEIDLQLEYVPKGILSFPVASHIVFYTTTAQGIKIERILHGSVNIDKYF